MDLLASQAQKRHKKGTCRAQKSTPPTGKRRPKHKHNISPLGQTTTPWPARGSPVRRQIHKSAIAGAARGTRAHTQGGEEIGGHAQSRLSSIMRCQQLRQHTRLQEEREKCIATVSASVTSEGRPHMVHTHTPPPEPPKAPSRRGAVAAAGVGAAIGADTRLSTWRRGKAGAGEGAGAGAGGATGHGREADGAGAGTGAGCGGLAVATEPG